VPLRIACRAKTIVKIMPIGVSDKLWKLLWDYDPNGLVVVDRNMRIRLVNPAFCEMLKMTDADLVDRDLGTVLGDIDDVKTAWRENKVMKCPEREYPRYHLYARRVIFPIGDEGMTACIMVDLTHEWQQRNEMMRIQRETLEQVNEVVNKHMHVAQEVAGLLGEATAETKVSLLKVRALLEQEVLQK